MPHVEKYTQAKVGLIIAHDLRAKNTEFRSADPNLESKNIYYVNNGEQLVQIRDDNKKMLAAARKYQEQLLQNTPHAKRKDLVTLGEWIVNCPKNIPENDRIKFLEASMKFVSKRYGSRNIVSAAMHCDEPHAMPHLHITVVPVDKKGRVCARNVFTRAELQHFHSELEKYTSRVLGYPVHILKDEDERAKVSLPLSQYKVETKSKDLDKKEKELEKQSKEVADKLEIAENTVSNARLHAVSAAAAVMENYDKTSKLKRFFSDPRPFVRDMAIELQTAAELERKAMDQRAKELDEQEKQIEQQKEELRQQQAKMLEQEQALQRRLALAEQMYKNAEDKEKTVLKYEKSIEERKNALAERENAVNERESMLKANADKYWSQKADEYQCIVYDSQRRYTAAKQALKKSFEIEKENWAWAAERERWKTVEEANKKLDELSLKYKSLADKYNAVCTENADNMQTIKTLKNSNEKLIKDNREIPYLKWRSEELDKTKARYSELTEKYNRLEENYNKLSTSHNDLKSLHDSVVDYAQIITTENAFFTDILNSPLIHGRLTDKQQYSMQICERIEQKYLDKTSNKQHTESIANIIDAAEKQKTAYEAKIDDAFAAAIRESRTEQRSRGIHHQSRSCGRSR